MAENRGMSGRRNQPDTQSSHLQNLTIEIQKESCFDRQKVRNTSPGIAHSCQAHGRSVSRKTVEPRVWVLYL